MSLTVNFELILRVYPTFVLWPLYIKLLDDNDPILAKYNFLNSFKL